MLRQLKDLTIHITAIPGIPGDRYPSGTGIVTLAKDHLAFDYRSLFLLKRHAEIKYADIDSYNRSLVGLYVQHHSKTCPRIVRLRAVQPGSGAELDALEAELMKHDIMKLKTSDAVRKNF